MGALIGTMVCLTILMGMFFLVRSHEREAGRRREAARPVRSADWLRGRLESMAEPSLVLEPATEPGFSKLGGRPEGLHAGVDANVESREFLCQIDFAEAHEAGGPEWLPDRGRLFAFYDPDGHGRPDVIRVIFEPQDGPSGPVVEHHAAYREQRVSFRRVTSLPNLEWIGVAHHRFEDSNPPAWENFRLMATAPSDDVRQHRIGGYPNEIQDEQMALVCEHHLRGLSPPAYAEDVTPELEAAADTWRLLLQIDSDDELGMEWGDAGRLYVFVRKGDARAGDFSKTVSLWQTY